MVMACSNSYNRINNKSYAQLKDWDKLIPKRFELKAQRPAFFPQNKNKEFERTEQTDIAIPKSHKKLAVRSVIHSPTWDKAIWRGCGYLSFGYDLPPNMALLFEDESAGRKIFEQWRDRFGDRDEKDEIAISIIRNVPELKPHHYIVQIGSSLPENDNLNKSRKVTFVTRYSEMNPDSSKNLNRFLADYRRIGVYKIVPGFLKRAPETGPEFDFSVAIAKKALTVKNADENQ